MDVETLGASPIGQLVPINGTDERLRTYDYFAYLPDPLPEVPVLTAEAWSAVAQATGALGQLKQACNHLPNPRLLIQPALMREALDTSALEGTYAALPEILEARLPQSKPSSPEVAEVRAYEQMANRAFEWIRERPVSMSMLSDLQGILAADSRVPVRDPGRVRQHQVVIGPEHCTVYDARYIPPPPDDRLTAGLEQWVKWINSPSILPGPLRCALGHYQFESLHPFGDGNGRVGRLVVTLQLLTSGELTEPAITLSPWFLRRREEYQAHLLAISKTGDWSPWVEFFCRAICDQAQRAVAVVDDLMAWLAQIRQTLNARHWSGLIVDIVESLVDWPIITVPWVSTTYEVSTPTAKSAVDRLVELEVLKQLSQGSYRRVFGASRVMELVKSLSVARCATRRCRHSARSARPRPSRVALIRQSHRQLQLQPAAHLGMVAEGSRKTTTDDGERGAAAGPRTASAGLWGRLTGMHITVFGANGRVGKLVVRRALDTGHMVTAFVHTNDPFDQHAQLRVSPGDVADADVVHEAVQGADAVISTLGAFRRGTGPVLAPGLNAITQAMRQHDARRLVTLTGAGVTRPGQRGDVRAHLNRFVLTLMDRTAVVDAEKALEIMAATDLAWTTVCAPTISDDGPDGYVLLEHMPSLMAKVPGPAVAAGLLALAERPTEGGSVVGIKAAAPG